MLCSPRTSRSCKRALGAARSARRRELPLAGREMRGTRVRTQIDDLHLRQSPAADARREREGDGTSRRVRSPQLSRLGVALPSTQTAPASRARTRIRDFLA